MSRKIFYSPEDVAKMFEEDNFEFIENRVNNPFEVDRINEDHSNNSDGSNHIDMEFDEVFLNKISETIGANREEVDVKSNSIINFPVDETIAILKDTNHELLEEGSE